MSADPSNDPPRRPVLGCLADDVTGATDLAINLVQGGMRVVQVLGVPTATELRELGADAIVVALKARALPADEAVEQSLAGLHALRELGVDRFFFKYCSTFDSTEKGNIGPVAAALMDALGVPQTIFCPAFPRNGRTVYQGHLFVRGQLLHESGMQDHPLNPMTDANLMRLLGNQTDRHVGLLCYDDLHNNAAAEQLQQLAAAGVEMVITDACHDGHLAQLAEAVAGMPLITGGSGIARFLPEVYRKAGILDTAPATPELPRVPGRSLIIAGSCSTATRQQVAWMAERCPGWKVEVPQLLANFARALEEVLRWASSCPAGRPLLVYSTSSAQEVAELQQTHGRQQLAAAIERFFADLAVELVAAAGVRRIVLAGGETSGAVVQALGIRVLRIGPEISAGVPWTEALGQPPLALALKSGNFGAENFFESALEMLP